MKNEDISKDLLNLLNDFEPAAKRYETPEGSKGECANSTIEFSRFVEAMDGGECSVVQVEAFKGKAETIQINKEAMGAGGMMSRRGGDETPDRMHEMGFGRGRSSGVNLIDPKEFVHNVNKMEMEILGNKIDVYIDWTARQFDPAFPFPMVMTASEVLKHWQKIHDKKKEE